MKKSLLFQLGTFFICAYFFISPSLSLSFIGYHHLTKQPTIDNYQMFKTPTKTDYLVNELNQYDTGFGVLQDIRVVNDLAFAVTHRGGLLVFNISDFIHPVLIGTYDKASTISESNLWNDIGGYESTSLAIHKDLVFFGKGLDGMVILNISNPKLPIELAHYEDKPIFDIQFYKNYIYGISYPGIIIIDISNPLNPYPVAHIDDKTFSSGLIYKFTIYNDFLFFGSSDTMVIVNITNPRNLFEIGRMGISLGQISICDNLLYSITSNSICNLQIINISDPSIPHIETTFELEEISSYVYDLVLNITNIYISTEKGIYSYSFNSSSDLIFLNQIEVPGFLNKINYYQYALTNGSNYNLLFCVNYNSGLQIIEISNTTNMTLVSTYDFGMQTMAVFANEDYVYLCLHHEYYTIPTKFVILQHNNGTNLQLLGEFEFTDTVILAATVYGSYAYIVGAGLFILNISDPTTPTLVGEYHQSGTGYARAIFYDHQKDLAFLAYDLDGFTILDVSNKSTPIKVYRGNLWGMTVMDLYSEGELLYLANGLYDGGFAIVNISNPYNPLYVSEVGLGESVLSIYVEEDLLYLSSDMTSLMIFEVSNPVRPVISGELYTGKWFDGVGLTVKDGKAYLAREENGLQVINVKNPKQPKLLIEYRDYYVGLSYDVTVVGSLIFLADGWDGLEVLELIPPEISRGLYLSLTIIPPTSGLILLIAITWNIARKKQD